MTKRNVIVGCLVLAAAVVAAWFVWGTRPTATPDGKPARVAKKAQASAKKNVAPRKEKAAKTKAEVVIARKGRRYKPHAKRNLQALAASEFGDSDHPYSAEDKKVSRELESASEALDEFDEEDFEAKSEAALKARARFLAAAEAGAQSANPAVREATVEAYAWQGAEMLPELTPMMADPDSGVAEAARDAVGTQLDDMEDPVLRLETAAAYVNTFASNADVRQMFSDKLVASASDIIEADDDTKSAQAAARENRNRVVEILADIIENGDPKAAATARESYAEITSEDWVSSDEAKRWASDPEHYEAP